MSELKHIDDLIDPNGNQLTVEEIRHENGGIYWLASELMRFLGYGDDMKSFSKAIRRATKTLSAMNRDVFSHISKTKLGTEKGVPDDYMFTRFGAYLVTMNADPNKPQVAKAQAYFIAMTRQFEMWLEQPDDFALLQQLVIFFRVPFEHHERYIMPNLEICQEIKCQIWKNI